MKEIVVTLNIKVNTDIEIDEVINNIYINNDDVDVVSVSAEAIDNDDPQDLCNM